MNLPTSQITNLPNNPPKLGALRGKNLPTPNPLYISRYIYRGVVRFFGRFPPPPFIPLFWEVGRKLGGLGGSPFLTVSLIAAGVFSAGASLTAPNYEQTTFPTWGASVHRTRVRPLSVSGFSIGRMKVNETTEQPCNAPISPRPWRVECRIVESTKTCHHPRRQWVLVDANGREVWHTEANVRFICDCVNEANKQ